MRHQDWFAPLVEYLAGASAATFNPGTHDCALFAAGAVRAMTGTDFAAEYRGRYTTLRGGVRVLRKAGYRDHIDLARSCLLVTESPSPGDLAVVALDDGSRALGVVQGTQVYLLRSTGLCLVPLAAAELFLKV